MIFHLPVGLAKRIADLGRKYGVGFHTHVAQKPQEVQFLRESIGMTPVEYLCETGLMGEDLTAAHCIYTDHRDIQLLAKGGCMVAHCAEMSELAELGYGNVVCTQPFGCLPNHINGKGMIRRIKELYPESNIVPIDYDPSATRVNQENRIKLMLAVAREELAKKTGEPERETVGVG